MTGVQTCALPICRAVALGNLRLLDDLGIVAPRALGERAEALRGKGQTGRFVVLDGRIGGLHGVADRIKGTTPGAMRRPHDADIDLVISAETRVGCECVCRRKSWFRS